MTTEPRPEFRITFKGATMEHGADVAPTGEVSFVLTNESESTHDFALVHVDREDGARERAPVRRVAAGDSTLVASADGVGPGDAETVTTTLEAGRYFVVSNSEGEHLGLALFELTVQPVDGSEPA